METWSKITSSARLEMKSCNLQWRLYAWHCGKKTHDVDLILKWKIWSWIVTLRTKNVWEAADSIAIMQKQADGFERYFLRAFGFSREDYLKEVIVVRATQGAQYYNDWPKLTCWICHRRKGQTAVVFDKGRLLPAFACFVDSQHRNVNRCSWREAWS